MLLGEFGRTVAITLGFKGKRHGNNGADAVGADLAVEHLSLTLGYAGIEPVVAIAADEVDTGPVLIAAIAPIHFGTLDLKFRLLVVGANFECGWELHGRIGCVGGQRRGFHDHQIAIEQRSRFVRGNQTFQVVFAQRDAALGEENGFLPSRDPGSGGRDIRFGQTSRLEALLIFFEQTVGKVT